MNRLKLVLVIFVVVLVGTAWYLSQHPVNPFPNKTVSESSPREKPPEFDISMVQNELAVVANSESHLSKQGEDQAEKQEPCIDLNDTNRDPRIYEHRSWLTELGMRSELTDRFLYTQSNEQLQTLVGQGDTDAMLALGLRLVWQSNHDSDHMPLDGRFMVPVWVDSDREFNRDLLQRARELFYEAALHGRVFALNEITWTYAAERQILVQTNDLSEELSDELQYAARLHAEAVEELIPALSEGFNTGPIPQRFANTFERDLQSMVRQFQAQRNALGLPPLRLEPPDSYFEDWNFCE